MLAEAVSAEPVPAESRIEPLPGYPPQAAPAQLGFIAGGGHWLIDAASGLQVIDAAITPVPLAKPWYLGLVRHRQKLLGAVDLAGLHGAGVVPLRPLERLLVLPEPWNTALRVDRVQGLMEGAHVVNADVTDVTDADGVRWQRLDIRRLCTSAAFLQAGLRATA